MMTVEKLEDYFERIQRNYANDDIGELTEAADRLYDMMMEEGRESEDMVECLLAFLLIQESIYSTMYEDAHDSLERRMFEYLRDEYALMQNVEKTAVLPVVYAYCLKEAEAAYDDQFRDDSAGWIAIAKAVQMEMTKLG